MDARIKSRHDGLIWSGLSVRELRVTGNAVKRTAILAGGSPTHLRDSALFPPLRRAIVSWTRCLKQPDLISATITGQPSVVRDSEREAKAVQGGTYRSRETALVQARDPPLSAVEEKEMTTHYQAKKAVEDTLQNHVNARQDPTTYNLNVALDGILDILGKLDHTMTDLDRRTQRIESSTSYLESRAQ